MKKLFLNIIYVIALCMLLPTYVFAEDTCKDMDVSIKSISMIDSEGIVIENNDPSFVDQSINLALKFYEFNSNVKYKVTIQNNSDTTYYIDFQDILENHIQYKIELIDSDNEIKPNGETSFYLVATYNSEVNEEDFVDGIYQNVSELHFLITDGEIGNIINPSTKSSIFFMLLLLVILTLVFAYQKRLGSKKTISLIVIGYIIVPLTIHGMCKYTIDLTANVAISNENVNVCNYDGELVQGAKFINGDYTYRYKQMKTEEGWVNIDEDGWGVTLTKNNTFTPIESDVCNIINKKEVVEESFMERTPTADLDYLTTSSRFKNGFGSGVTVDSFETITIVDNKIIPSNAIKSWDVSNKGNGSIQAWYIDEDSDGMYELYIGADGGVLANPDMSYYFYEYSNVEDTNNFNKLDVSGVTNMNGFMLLLGSNSSTFSIDVSGWDTRNVTDMSVLFSSAGNNATSFEVIGLESWNTSNVKTMTGMFASAGSSSTDFSIGQLTNWDTKKVTNMSNMFAFAGENATNWESLGELNIYSASIGGSNIAAGMFAYCRNAKVTLNLHNNITTYRHAFDTASTKPGSQIIVNYSEAVTNIDRIINTKSSNGNVIKGELID